MSRADLLLRERVVLAEAAFAEIVVWRVPTPVRGSTHNLKYSLALVADRCCVLRYDNERGKGDHCHRFLGADGTDEVEEPYRFRGADALIADFWRNVDAWIDAWKNGDRTAR